MKARMMRVAGLLLAGTITFSVAYANPAKEVDTVVSANVRAGVSSEFCTEVDTYRGNMTASSGVTGGVTDYLSSSVENAATEIAVEEADTVMTASG